MKKALTVMALATLLVAGLGFAGCASKKCCTDGTCPACVEKANCPDCQAGNCQVHKK